MLRYVSAALAASVAATVTCLMGMFLYAGLTGGRASHEDASGFAVLSFVSGLLLAVLLYAPVLAYGRRRWRWSRGKAALVAALALNLPAYAYLAIGVVRGGLFGGASEAALFGAAFAAAGLVFAAVSNVNG